MLQNYSGMKCGHFFIPLYSYNSLSFYVAYLSNIIQYHHHSQLVLFVRVQKQHAFCLFQGHAFSSFGLSHRSILSLNPLFSRKGHVDIATSFRTFFRLLAGKEHETVSAEEIMRYSSSYLASQLARWMQYTQCYESFPSSTKLSILLSYSQVIFKIPPHVLLTNNSFPQNMFAKP